MTSPSDQAQPPSRGKIVWQYLLSYYLGKRGYRASLIAYGIGFWIFAIGAILVLASGENPGIVMLVLRNIFLHVGLFILVMMTYPVIRCAFDMTDMTRPKGRFRRIFEPVVVTLFAPLYLMLLVSSFMQYALAPTILGN
jgi:hypothetical protein